MCEPLQVISDCDAEDAEVVPSAAEFEVLRDFLADNGPEILGAYDEVGEQEPSLAEDAATLSEITEATLDAAVDATSLSELAAILLANPNVEEAGLAGQRPDEFRRRSTSPAGSASTRSTARSWLRSSRAGRRCPSPPTTCSPARPPPSTR